MNQRGKNGRDTLRALLFIKVGLPQLISKLRQSYFFSLSFCFIDGEISLGDIVTLLSACNPKLGCEERE